MAKVRVYELARELNLESKVLVTKVQALGISVSSHQSTLSSQEAEKVRVVLQAPVKKQVVVRRRKKPVSSAPVPSPESTETEQATKVEDKPLKDPIADNSFSDQEAKDKSVTVKENDLVKEVELKNLDPQKEGSKLESIQPEKQSTGQSKEEPQSAEDKVLVKENSERSEVSKPSTDEAKKAKVNALQSTDNEQEAKKVLLPIQYL